jgi:hypothetical protein
VGLQEDFTAAAADGMAAFLDLQQNATYHSAGTETYDPATGRSSSTPVEISVPVIVTRFRAMELSTLRAQPNDRKVLIEAVKLVTALGVAVTPKLTDWIEVGSARWEIIQDLSPPVAETIYVLHVREAA